ncbi:hypothetical protein GCK32_002754 [Trichostrongylus colubriformis]|uniref:SWIB domain-containing protein n=1 Tax=Trichostrongylus colubriformis TaxID=6319 RepID=A0AAN8FIQ3_TRICO
MFRAIGRSLTFETSRQRMSSSDEDSFPVDRNEAMDAIEKMINAEGLDKLTSSKIRAHLSSTFNQSFDNFRKEVDSLTKEVIERREKREEKPLSRGAQEKPSPEKSHAASDTDSDTSDEGVVDDRRASPKKKFALKRKAHEEEGDVDLMTAVKHRRRAAADKAAQILKKTADRSKKKDKNAPKGDHSGKFGRMTKLCLLSEELQSIVGARFMKRCDVISKMWEYIRANNLFDPKDKRFCFVDDKLRGVFGPCKRFRAFAMSKPLAKHIKDTAFLGGEIEQEALAEEARLTAEWKARQAVADGGSAERFVDRRDLPTFAMPVEDARVKGSPVGNFFARLGRRVRSKSPAVTRLSASETPKRPSSRGAHADSVSNNRQEDSGDASQTPHRFGTLINRLSRRKSKKGEKDLSLISPDSDELAISQPLFGTPRPAMSENDLRHVTLQRGTDLHVTPLAGVSQFMSEDNLAVSECGTPAYRVPSYVRISCALSGYRRSPRYLENSASRAMGRSIVERRLGLFEKSPQDRNEALHQTDSELRVDRSVLAMGTSFSTPSPIKALIGQFDRLQLCSKEKKNVDDYTEPTKTSVITQPTSSSVTEKTAVSTAAPDSLEVSTMSAIIQEVPKKVQSSSDIIEDDGEVSASTAKKFGDMRTGEDFLVLLESVRSRLEASIKQVLCELEEMDVPEEAASSIRLAAGKAQLLVRKKLSKFDELVRKNLNPVDGDHQPATIDDLEGYWALVEIELNDIDECFQKVDQWRANGWQMKEFPESQSPVFVNSNNNNNVAKKKVVSSRPLTTPVDPELRAKQVEKQKAATEMRRKALAEAKQKARAAQQAQETAAKSDANVTPCSDVLMVLLGEGGSLSLGLGKYVCVLLHCIEKQNLREMAVIQNQAWWKEACFSSFWAHYHAVEKWRADHARMASVSCRIAAEKKKHSRRKPVPQAADRNTNLSRERTKKLSIKEKVKEGKHVPNTAYVESVSMEVDEMSDEMVAFFKKTIEHRRIRDAERTEKGQRAAMERGEEEAHWIQLDDDEYVLADKIGVYGVEKRTFAAPDEEARTKLRRENARQLYGSKAEQILAMETLMDMRFEQEYARKRPPLWPNIPLKF